MRSSIYIFLAFSVLQSTVSQPDIRRGRTWIIRGRASGQGSGRVSNTVFPYRIVNSEVIENPIRVVSLREVLGGRTLETSGIQNEDSRRRTSLLSDPNARQARRAQKTVFYSQYRGFQPITLSGNDKDSCYMRIKTEFDGAYPRLPSLVSDASSVNTLSDPVPSRVSELPTNMSPLYVQDSIAYVPYRLESTDVPLKVPFNRETRKLAYPELPLLLPYTQLSINGLSENRKYVIFIPFQPDGSRNLTSCPPVSVPVIFRKGNFPKYAPYRVRIGTRSNNLSIRL